MYKLAFFLLSVSAWFCAGSGSAWAQKKPLDHDVYDGWQSVAAVQLSPDGRLLSYEIRPQEGDGTLYVKDLTNGTEISVPRGTGLRWAQDLSLGYFTVKAPFADTRQARIDKKKSDDQPKDSLARIDLAALTWEMVGVSGTAKTGYETAPYLFAAQPAKDRKTKDLLVIKAETGLADTLKYVSDFATSSSGDRLVVTTAKEEKDSLSFSAVILYDLPAERIDTLSSGREEYANAGFNAAGDKIVFTSTDDKQDEDGTPRHTILLAQETVLKKATRRTPAVTEWRTCELLAADCAGLPEGWVVGKESGPAFSNNSTRLVLRLQEYFPPKDTTVYDFEAAQLDIWVWDKHTVPPMDKVGRNRNQRTAVVNLDRPGQLLVLSQNSADRITFFSGAEGDYALSSDTDAYVVGNMWDAESRTDISLVSLRDGSRRLLRKGAVGYASPSPYGKYIAWFDPQDGNWYSWNLATDALVNLTGATGVAFWDEEDDHPIPGYTPIGNPSWVGEDDALLLTDRYDVWKFQPDGKKAECLTRGAGRRDAVHYRPVQLDTRSNPYLYRDIRTFPTKGRLWMSAFNEQDKRNGYACVDIAKGGEPQGFLAQKSYSSVTRSADGSAIAYLKGDFRHPMDLYLTRDEWASETKLTAINPQQDDYRWGNVQLVRWNAYDGTPLDGLLFTPDGLDASKKYPMMIYFYEKYSETLYDYRAPAPSRSTVNIPFYVSRGYVVFIPDIVYRDGHPGESAYNCICAGAEAMCRQFSYIDKDKMAIQGQSWGGYQTAYLITRTDMFAAAGAGAPVGNMTSAYGGIRWESGSSRIPQYEHGQSRIGKTLWEEGGLDLYVENSPVFHAPNVTTPVLIMHNDNDGAVPWYQGIEFFMSLRRLGKPAWLLEYNNEAHNLAERRNSKDLSVRLQQFFDHYLQGAPEPVWMQSGIPYARKGNYFATELAE
ncbi:MAG: prolyl oligopeptidase family serine peptidase [Bacteroidales bacterium]|jgi:dipeptidyl aminopeptidase/acylaminoacyl peptidase|nr:prolyl oligopeptidase family serine peptidase [Bacteroidales bacterium]